MNRTFSPVDLHVPEVGPDSLVLEEERVIAHRDEVERKLEELRGTFEGFGTALNQIIDGAVATFGPVMSAIGDRVNKAFEAVKVVQAALPHECVPNSAPCRTHRKFPGVVEAGRSRRPRKL